MKKLALSILIIILIPFVASVGLYIHAVYFHKGDLATQAYLDEKDPFRKLELLEVTLNQDEYSRWAWLDEAAELAYRTKQYEKAKGYALESLSLSGRHKDDWNHGNSIHNANMVLGRLRLRKGDVEKAKDYLLRSAESQGSPQLDTFGPSLELANQLLLAGKRDAVLRYLESISSFWEMDNGCIEEWIAQIENNQTPELCNCKCR